LHFLEADGHVLGRRPALLFQQAANQPDHSIPAEAARRRLHEGREKRPWLRWVNRPEDPSPCLAVLTGHQAVVFSEAGHTRPAFVSACALSPDGQLAASGSEKGELALWEVRSGRLLQRWPGHVVHRSPEEVAAVAFSPDGKHLASTSRYRILLWDVTTGSLINEAGGLGAEQCAWSRDGRRLFASTSLALECRDPFEPRTPPTPSFEASPWGNPWGVTPPEQDPPLWRWKPGVPLRAFMQSPDGDRILVMLAGELLVLDAQTGADRGNRVQLDEWPHWLEACAVSPRLDRVVGGGAGGILRLWDAATGSLVATLSGHTGPLEACAFSADGTTIASASQDHTVRIWNAATGEEIVTLAGHGAWVQACCLAEDGSLALSASRDGAVRVWSTARQRSEASAAHGERVNACAYSPDGSRIVSGGEDGTLKVWDGTSGRLLRTIETVADSIVTSCTFIGRGSEVAAGLFQAVEYFYGHLGVWDSDSGRLPRNFKDDARGVVRRCTMFPDGTRLLTAEAHSIFVRQLPNGEVLLKLGEHPRVTEWCACTPSPDGERALAASSDGQVTLWDARTGAVLASRERPVVLGRGLMPWWETRARPGGALVSLEGIPFGFTPDGTAVAVATPRGPLARLHPKTLQPLFPPPVASVPLAALSSDGSRLAVAPEREPVVQVRHAETGEPMCEYWIGFGVTAVLWNPRADLLAVGDDAGRVVLLRLEEPV
jgi:WD40 repeat protein